MFSFLVAFSLILEKAMYAWSTAKLDEVSVAIYWRHFDSIILMISYLDLMKK